MHPLQLFLIAKLSFWLEKYEKYFHLDLWKIPVITQFDEHKLVFLPQQGDSQIAISWKLVVSLQGVQSLLKKFEKTG